MSSTVDRSLIGRRTSTRGSDRRRATHHSNRYAPARDHRRPEGLLSVIDTRIPPLPEGRNPRRRSALEHRGPPADHVLAFQRNAAAAADLGAGCPMARPSCCERARPPQAGVAMPDDRISEPVRLPRRGPGCRGNIVRSGDQPAIPFAGSTGGPIGRYVVTSSACPGSSSRRLSYRTPRPWGVTFMLAWKRYGRLSMVLAVLTASRLPASRLKK